MIKIFIKLLQLNIERHINRLIKLGVINENTFGSLSGKNDNKR